MSFQAQLELIVESLDDQLTTLSDLRKEASVLLKLTNEYGDRAAVDIQPLKIFASGPHKDICGGINGIRWQIQTDGKAMEKCGAVIRRGNRILIDPPRYIEYLRSHGTHS
jgi:hypothetical protein